MCSSFKVFFYKCRHELELKINTVAFCRVGEVDFHSSRIGIWGKSRSEFLRLDYFKRFFLLFFSVVSHYFQFLRSQNVHNNLKVRI